MKTSGCDSIFCHLQAALQCTIPDVMTLHHLTEVHVGFGMRKRHPLLKRPEQGEATSEQNGNGRDAQFINEICQQEILHRATAINVQRMMTLGMDLSQHLDGTARKQRRMLLRLGRQCRKGGAQNVHGFLVRPRPVKPTHRLEGGPPHHNGIHLLYQGHKPHVVLSGIGDGMQPIQRTVRSCDVTVQTLSNEYDVLFKHQKRILGIGPPYPTVIDRNKNFGSPSPKSNLPNLDSDMERLRSRGNAIWGSRYSLCVPANQSSTLRFYLMN